MKRSPWLLLGALVITGVTLTAGLAVALRDVNRALAGF